jgi:hypothetical protein
MAWLARGSAGEAYFVKHASDASHAWQPTHNLCDRWVASVINSVRSSTCPYFPGSTAVRGGNRRHSSYGGKQQRGLDSTRTSMSDQHGFISADQSHSDPYTESRNAERTLNAAIVHADISRSYEEYLEVFDEFYADDIEGSSETMKEPIHGRESVRSLLFSFLLPLHALAEVGGVSISVRETAIPGDAFDETHSAWTLELVGVSGKLCTVSWRILRKWNESRVVMEHHYDYKHSGEPLTGDDLRFNTLEPAIGSQRPS